MNRARVFEHGDLDMGIWNFDLGVVNHGCTKKSQDTLEARDASFTRFFEGTDSFY